MIQFYDPVILLGTPGLKSVELFLFEENVDLYGGALQAEWLRMMQNPSHCTSHWQPIYSLGARSLEHIFNEIFLPKVWC